MGIAVDIFWSCGFVGVVWNGYLLFLVGGYGGWFEVCVRGAVWLGVAVWPWWDGCGSCCCVSCSCGRYGCGYEVVQGVLILRYGVVVYVRTWV